MKHLYAWLVVLVLLAGTAQAAIYFDTDFETCNVGTGNDFPCEGWDDQGIEFINAPNHNKIEIVNNLSLTGSKSVKGTWVNTQCSLQHPSLYKSVTQNDSMFARFGMRRSSNYQMSFNNISKMVRFLSRTNPRSGYPVVSVWFQAPSGPLGQDIRYIVGVEGGWGMGSVNYTGGPLVSSTSWDQVEIEIQMNTPGVSNGLVRLWVNGVLYIERLNLQLRGPALTSVNAQGLGNPSDYRIDSAEIFVQCGAGNVWFDRFGVGNTRLGTVGAVQPLDTTPPLAPTNLAASVATSTLTWTAGSDPGSPSSGYGGVHVFRCVRNPGDCTATTQIATVAAPATSYVDAGCSPGFTCDYRIRSFDGVGLTSAFTAEVSLTVVASNRRVLFSDTFNRADNADIGSVYDAGYTTGNPFKIVAGKLASSLVGSRNFESYNVAVPNDQFISILAADGINAAENVYAMTRMSAPATWNGYECGILDTTSGRLLRLDAGVGTVLATATISPAFTTGDRIRAESQGSTHRCYRVRTNAQGVQSEELYASAIDATYASGRPGVRIFPTITPGIRISELLIGDFTNSVNSTISQDSTATSALANTASTVSWSHTVANQSNRLLSVCVQSRNATTAATVTNVTANGTSLVKFREDTTTSAGNAFYTSLWRQIAPATGLNTIVATFSAAPSSWGVGSSSSFYGVEQVAPVDAVGGASGVGTAVSLPVTPTVTGTLAIDCVAGLDDFTGAGGSQTVLRNGITTVGTDGVGSSAKALASAGAASTTWTQASSTAWVGSVMAIKPAQVNNLQRPMILGGTVTPTGATGLTYGSTPPTAVKVIHGQNGGGVTPQEATIPIANVPSGVLTRTWQAGDEFAQILAVDAFGITNTTNQEYIAQSLIGVAPATSDDPVVMTNPQPSTELPAGTPSANITMTVDQVQISRECRWSDTDQAYASMPTANQMVINGTLASGTKPGLSNGNNYTVYRTCITLDSGGTLIAESPTRSSSTFSVASSTGDTTPPGNVSNVVCLANGTQADCTHSSATDAVSYEAYISSDAGVTYILASTYAAPTVSFSLLGLSPQQPYSVKVLARDAVGNPSAADSNISTFVMPALTDVTPPGDVPFLQIVPFTNSVLATFSVGTDAVDTTILGCLGVGCTPGEISKNTAFSPILIEGLTSGTVYRWTAIHHDAAGNASVNRYPNIEITTTNLGLDRPRAELRFGADRASAPGRSDGGARSIRDPCGE